MSPAYNSDGVRYTMHTGKDISYVEMAHQEPSEALASFLLRRFDHITFSPPADETPHRHNYQELFVVQSGHGLHTIDGQMIELLPRTVSVIGKGQVHAVEHFTDLTGWLVRFSDDFLPTEMLSPSGQYSTTLFQQLGAQQTITLEASDLDRLASILGLLEAEWSQPSTREKEQTLRHLLAVLIIGLERVFRDSQTSTMEKRDANRLYQRFVTLLEHDFAQHHDVQYYAAALGVTPVRLSRILGSIIGKSTKQIIDERIVLEAKRFLHYTDMSITGIAEALGYSDQFHLSKTFKRLTGIAPQSFREERQKMT